MEPKVPAPAHHIVRPLVVERAVVVAELKPPDQGPVQSDRVVGGQIQVGDAAWDGEVGAAGGSPVVRPVGKKGSGGDKEWCGLGVRSGVGEIRREAYGPAEVSDACAKAEMAGAAERQRERERGVGWGGYQPQPRVTEDSSK